MIDITLLDKIDKNIRAEIVAIGSAVGTTSAAIKQLQQHINGINAKNLAATAKAINAAANAEFKRARAATEAAKTREAEHKATTAKIKEYEAKALSAIKLREAAATSADRMAASTSAKILAAGRTEQGLLNEAIKSAELRKREQSKTAASQQADALKLVTEQQRTAQSALREQDKTFKQQQATSAQVAGARSKAIAEANKASEAGHKAETARIRSIQAMSGAQASIIQNTVRTASMFSAASAKHTQDQATTARKVAEERARAATAQARASDEARVSAASAAAKVARAKQQEAAADAMRPHAGAFAANALNQSRARTSQMQSASMSAASRAAQAQSNAAAAASRAQTAYARAQVALSRLNGTVRAAAKPLGAMYAAHRKATATANAHTNAMGRLERSCGFLRSDALRWSKVLAALGGVTLTAHHITEMADAYTVLQNKLSVVADGAAHVNTLTDEMFKLARDTRAPVAQVAQSFVRFDMALEQLGASQSETIRMTQTVSKALTLAGATAGEQRSGLLQLAQAFNKGKLDGDEFRSMMENAPMVMDAVARRMGVLRGQLLKLAPQGKITAQIMREALAEAADVIDEKFKKTAPTIAQAFTVLRNETMLYFGKLGTQTGVLAGISSAIMTLADNLDKLTFAVLLLTPALVAFLAPRLWSHLARAAVFIGAVTKAIVGMRSPTTMIAGLLASLANILKRTLGVALIMMSTGLVRINLLSVAAGIATAMFRGLATAAMFAGRAVLVAFSFGGLIAIFATLIAGAIAFGDQMVLNAQTGVTMRDMTIASFQELFSFVSYVMVEIANSILDALGLSEYKFEDFGRMVAGIFWATFKTIGIIIDGIFTGFSWLRANIITVFTNIAVAVKNTFIGLSNVFKTTFNMLADFVNSAIDGVSGLVDSFNTVLEWLGKPQIMLVKVDKKELTDLESYGSSATWSSSTAGSDFVNTAKSRVDERAAKMAADRKKAELRAAGENKLPPPDEKKDKKAESRASKLLKFREDQNAAIKVALMLGKEKERQDAIEGLNADLLSAKMAGLSALERRMLGALVDRRIKLEELGGAMQAMYDDIRKPADDYSLNLRALNTLIEQGTISVDEYNRKKLMLTESFEKSKDAAYDLGVELKSLREKQQYGTTADVYAEVQELVKAQRELTGEVIKTGSERYKELTALVAEATELRKIKELRKEIYDGSIQKQLDDLSYKQAAYNDLLKEEKISLREYNAAMRDMQAEQMRLQLEKDGARSFFDPLRVAYAEFVAEMPTFSEGIADALKNSMTNAVDQISDSVADMLVNFDSMQAEMEEKLGRNVSTLDVIKEKFKEIGRSIVQELIASLIKLGIQWVIQATLGQALGASMMAATVGVNAAAANALAAMWATPAALASLATFGTNAAPAQAGIFATVGTAQTMAMASALPRFADGGLVGGSGTGRSDSTLALLSRGEMVMNERAVSANYDTLTAMNQQRSVSVGGAVSVRIENYAGGVTHEVAYATHEEVVIIARNIASQEVKRGAGRAVAADFADPSSKASRAIASNTTARRKDI